MNNKAKPRYGTDFLENYKILSLEELKELTRKQIREDDILYKIHPDIFEPGKFEMQLPFLILSITGNYQDRDFVELAAFNLLFGDLGITLDSSYIQSLFTNSIHSCNYNLFKMLINKGVVVGNNSFITAFCKIRGNGNQTAQLEERRKMINDLLKYQVELDERVLMQSIEFGDIKLFQKLFKAKQLRHICADESYLQDLILNKKLRMPERFFAHIIERIVGIKVEKIMKTQK